MFIREQQCGAFGLNRRIIVRCLTNREKISDFAVKLQNHTFVLNYEIEG
jgi:hypothetical protein